MELKKLVDYLNNLLRINEYQDYCPNGLQIEGSKRVDKIITGVFACQEIIDIAVKEQADAILVHHGFFWKNEEPVISGIKKQRLQALLSNNISLLAYHLPLDYHFEFGNNIQLAKVLDINITNTASPYMLGEFARSITPQNFSKHLDEKLHYKPQFITGKKEQIKTIAWCTGAAQDYLEQAAAEGVDAYLTGEISEQTIYSAHELDINLFVAGHYATEWCGVKALGQHLHKQFKLESVFVDIDSKIL